MVGSAALALASVGTMLVGVPPAQAAPGGPTGVTATPGRRAIVVTWSAPGGGGATNYVATASPGNATCATAGLTCTITGLTAGTTYTVEVKACAAPNGTDCSAGVAAGATATPGPPTAPTKPTVSYFAAPDKMLVEWTATDPGSNIASFRVTPSNTAGLSGTCMALVPAAERDCVVEGLNPGTAYTFRVVANGKTTAIGNSPASPASDAKIAGPPNRPAAPTVVAESESSVTVSWEAPAGGPDISSYTVVGSDGTNDIPVDMNSCSPFSCLVEGLDAETEYTFTVQANGEDADPGDGQDPEGGISQASPASAPIIPGLPGAPDAPTVELGAEPGVVTIFWEEPAGPAVTSYTVTSDPGDAVLTNCNTPGNSAMRSCDVTGLQDGAPYRFRVAAVNAAGTTASAWSDTVVSALPGKPGTPVATVTGSGEVTLTWDPPSDTGGTVTGYTVESNPSSGTPSSNCGFDLVNPTCTFTGLNPTTQAYTFVVTAIGDVGTTDSDPSNAVVPAAPSAPTSVQVAVTSASTATVTWAIPGGGAAVQSHTVTVTGPSQGSVVVPSSCLTATAVTCAVSGLSPGGTYTFVVAAVNDVDATPAAGVERVMAVPSTPASVEVEVTSGTTATVTWDNPAGGGPVVSHTVTVTGPSQGSVVVPSSCLTAGAETCDVTGLTAGGTYTFVVAAVNAVGPAAAAGVQRVLAVPSTPASVEVEVTSATTATVTWDNPAGGGPVVSHTVTVTGPSQGSVDVPSSCLTAGAETCDVTGLTAGGTYTFVVAAVNAVGPAAAAGVAVEMSAPSAPASVAVRVTSGSTATVTWVIPGDGGPVTAHTVTVTGPSQGSVVVPSSCLTATAVTCAVTGLTPDETYTFEVAAVNAVDATPAAGVDVLMSAPSAPASVQVAVTSASTATVTWDITSDGGPVTAHTVTVTGPSQGSVVVPSSCLTATAVTCAVSGLTAGGSYTFVVAAVNGAGPTPASGVQRVLAVPSTPASVEVEVTSATTATVTWDNPAGGGPVVSHTVTVTGPSQGSVDVPSSCLTAGAETCDVTGLTAGGTYTFVVAAVNAVGPAAATGVVRTMAAPGAPGKPTVSALDVDAGTATVSWTAPNTGGPVVSYTLTSTGTSNAVVPGGCGSNLVNLSCQVTGIVADGSYRFVVAAVNAVGPTSSAPSDVVLAASPNAPGTPTVLVTGSGEVQVTWTAPPSGGPVSYYSVTASGGPTTPAGCDHVDDGLTCTITNLDPATSYTFRVTAHGPAGATQSVDSSEPVIPGVPSAPGTPEVQLAGPNKVRVTWDPADDGGPVTGYTVVSDPSVIAPDGCTDVRVTSCVFDDLTSGTPYTFTVVATGAVGEPVSSEPSAEITPGPPDAPAKPTVALTADPTEVRVTWEVPAEGAGIVGYTVQSKPGNKGCATPADSSDVVTCVVTGLEADAQYAFRVQAIGLEGSGNSAFSPLSDKIIPGAVGAPTDVDVAAANRQIAVAWTAPEVGIERVAHYRATASPGGATCQTDDATTTECVITGLTNTTSYRVTVTAVGVDGSGESAPSAASIRVRPTAGLPGPPTQVTASPLDSAALVSWVAPAVTGDGIARYTATATGASGTHSCLTPNGTTLSCTITGLTNTTAYTVTVVAIGRAASGNSVPSTTAVSVTPGVAPGTPTVESVIPGIANLRVTFVPGPAGDGVANYTVTAAGGPSSGPCIAPADANFCVISGVTPGTNYTITVVANGTIAGLRSQPSEPSAAVRALSWPAPTLPATVPSSTLVFGLVTSSAGSSMRLNSTTTVSGNGFAPYTGVTVGIYPGPVVLATTTTDSTGAFTVPVTISGVAVGSRTLVAGGMRATGLLRYRSSTVNVLAPLAGTLAAASRADGPLMRVLPASRKPELFAGSGTAR